MARSKADPTKVKSETYELRLRKAEKEAWQWATGLHPDAASLADWIRKVCNAEVERLRAEHPKKRRSKT